MKFLEKIKTLTPKLSSRKGKIIGFSMLILGSVVATTMTALAWFNLTTKESTIQMVTGDIDVEINKVSAYKYVYPYYKRSTEFIDYDSPGTIKKYVLEDHVLTYDNTDVDSITINTDNAVASLGTKYQAATTTVLNNASATSIYVPNDYVPDFHYYLIGDGLFSGVESGWNINNAYAFAQRENIAQGNGKHAIMDNVVISAGSSFALFEAVENIRTVGNVEERYYTYNYIPVNSVTANSPFKVSDIDENQVGHSVLCIRSGIYTFDYSGNQLELTLRTSDGGQKKDVSVIMNNSLDPTKVTIEYAGSVSAQQQTINQYLPTAIHNQNTMLVLDVELNFKNVNPVEASLKIERTKTTNADSDHSISKLSNAYSNTTAYQDDGTTLRASDFYNFYAKFTKTPYASGAAIWDGEHNGMHIVANSSFVKFSPEYNKTSLAAAVSLTTDQSNYIFGQLGISSATVKQLYDLVNDNGFLSEDAIALGFNAEKVASIKSLYVSEQDTVIPCPLNLKEQNDSLVVLPKATDNVYHCYIAIEYDYEHCMFFLDKNRLGKTYYLDRDFTFHFYGTQYRQPQQTSQGNEENQGQCMKKARFFTIFYLAISTLLVSTIALSVGLTITLFNKEVEGNGTYGEVSLRSYYESGSGTSINDPFIITRPRHLYNLSRLQGLGVYGEKVYFQLGKVGLAGDTSGLPMCYPDDNTSDRVVPYLDMSHSDKNTNPINAIGSEALPFYGEFNGNNVEIRDLNVYASPQDAGLFGYTAHGSKVYNLFLSNITINALGYTSDFKDLYKEKVDPEIEGDSLIEDDVWLTYNPHAVSGNVTTDFKAGGNTYNIKYSSFHADADFNYTETGSSPTPTVSITDNSTDYDPYYLISGDLIKENANKQIVPNFTRLFEFFKTERSKQGATFPIQATSSVSLVVSSMDRYGQKHSKVVLNLEYDYSLETAASTSISLGVHLTGDHGNNIGLIIGHCDGTITDCYVYNGSFVMNNGGSSYTKVENGSDLGLIGKVGSTVQNVLAVQSDVGAKEGKNIGVVDFTTIYNDVIDANSFPQNPSTPQGLTQGIVYTPRSDSDYLQYLRYYLNQYVTYSTGSVSFKGQTIIKNDDLGVFTIATDPKTEGGPSSGDYLTRSVVLSESTDQLTVNGNYYIYYATGEYNKDYHTKYGGTTFDNYLSNFNSKNNSYILPGYSLPQKDQVTRDSFYSRESRQNYFLRFKLDPNRDYKGFYLSGLDTDTDGGAFFANYFNYKLVDQDGIHIATNDSHCGLMLKNNRREEISSFSASFGLPDLTDNTSGTLVRAYCSQDSQGNKYVGNMINFEITTAMANVTVIAAPTNPGGKTDKCAALGIYKLENNDFLTEDDTGSIYFKKNYNQPDYAFFMPADGNLAYYDYHYNGTTQKGEIGTYTSNGTFVPNAKKATVPSDYNVTEYGYSSGKTRLFAHTFCLPRGRYCMGSASSANQYVPKVYYICAQGQDNGQFDFDDTVFASTDRVENVDFTKVARFDENNEEAIIPNDENTVITSYNPSGNNIVDLRCYVALVNSQRSTFLNTMPSCVSFKYDEDTSRFIVSAILEDEQGNQTDTRAAIKYIAVDNYEHSYASPSPRKNLTVYLIDQASNNVTNATNVVVYPHNQEVFMKVKNIFKGLCFLTALILTFGACNNTSSSNAHKSKYLLNGTFAATSGDYDYYSINNGNEYAVALNKDSKSKTELPNYLETYNSKPVTGIYRNGFFNSQCTSIPILPSITVIDYEAFMASKIQSIVIPSTVTQIGESAFYSCRSLTKVTIQNNTSSSSEISACSCITTSSSSSNPSSSSSSESSSVSSSSSSSESSSASSSSNASSGSSQQSGANDKLTVIPAFCFFNCVSLKELILPESIKTIEHEAFQGCSAMFSTLALSNIEKIGYRAFQGCSALRKIYIGSSFFKKDNEGNPIGVIEEFAFTGCSQNLEFYLVDPVEDNITAWLAAEANANWNQMSEFSDPQNKIDPDTSSERRYTYHITTSGASYTSDWLYAINLQGEVEISSYIGPTEIEGSNVTFLSIPDYLPSGSSNPVRSIATTAFSSVKANLQRLYLPKTLKKIANGQFDSGYTSLVVIDDNDGSKCTADTTSAASGSLTPRIILNGLTSLEAIGNEAFVNLPSLPNVQTLYLPYSVKAVGRNAFGSQSRHMRSVTDFMWVYDDTKSALETIGKEAFYKLGNSSSSNDLDGTHTDYLQANGTHNYELTTLVLPRTFKHFGITSTENSAYGLGGADTDDSGFGARAFAGCPLLEKVIFKGSSKTNGSYNSDSPDLVIPALTFAMDTSLRTIVFEERNGKSIVFYTGGYYQPSIGWSSGKGGNDFGGDPALQTLVLPNTVTTLRIQNYAFQGNSRGVIYLSSGTTSNIYGHISSKCTEAISNPSNSDHQCAITASDVKNWRTIGNEDEYSNGVYPGYYFTEHNHFGIDQKMPLYGNVHYTDSVNKTGVVTTVEIGTTANTSKEYVEKDKCAFLCSSTTATMTNYLYDRHNSAFTGTATVPAEAKSGVTVTEIGDSAFSAAYCDTNSYNGYSDYKDLTKVYIPNTITSIGDYAFMRAYGVVELSTYDSNGNLMKPTQNGTAGFVMPENLASIGKHAFAFCNISKFLNIPTTCIFHENAPDTEATDFETSVFSNNFSLRKITFGADATYSTYYKTTTYTHQIDQNTSETYTSAIYSTDSNALTRNKSSLLLVLNRDSADYRTSSGDSTYSTVTVDQQELTFVVFDGKYTFGGTYTNNVFLYGAFKMGHWIDSLTIGTANTSEEQPLISGVTDKVYLNQPSDYMVDGSNGSALKSISFGNATTISTPSFSFSGCSNLTYIKLPRNPGGTIPAGLLASVENEHIRFEVPKYETGNDTKICAEGELDLTYTGYVGIEADAFKNSGIKKVKAPITTNFTIGENAFSGCSLTEFDFSNVTGTVTLNGSFKSNDTKTTTIAANTFKFVNNNLVGPFVAFGAETFKGCKFTGKSFTFPTKTTEIGASCFEGCSTLETVDAAGDLVNLIKITDPYEIDAVNQNKNNYDKRNEGFIQIGNFAFFQCTNLKSFDFSRFPTLERIGHFAFGMAKIASGKADHGNAPLTNNATIVSGGVLDLPASLTNLGVGAFFGTKITKVTINSTSMKYERAAGYTSSPRLHATHKVGAQFRYCTSLVEVIFTENNCAWNTAYEPKGSNTGQDNYYSNCTALLRVYMPNTYELYRWADADSPTNNERPDGMVYLSNSSVYFYLYHTFDEYHGVINRYWRRTNNNDTRKNYRFYVNNSLELADENHNLLATTTGIEFWTQDKTNNNARIDLGTVTSIISNGGNYYAKFSSGYYIDQNGNLSNTMISNISAVISNGAIADGSVNYLLKDGSDKPLLFLGTAYYFDSTNQVVYFSSGYTLDANGAYSIYGLISDLSSVIQEENGVYSIVDNTTVFYYYDNGTLYCLGTADSVSVDPDTQVVTVSFSSGATLTSEGTFTAPVQP